MAMTQQQRDAKTKAKREAAGEVELRHRVCAGTRQCLEELMDWHGFTEQAEALQMLIMNAKAQGEERARLLLVLWHCGEKEAELIRHRDRPSVVVALSNLATFHSLSNAEAVQALVLNAHALGREESAELLAVPRHEFQISESVARALEQEGQRQAARLDRSEE